MAQIVASIERDKKLKKNSILVANGDQTIQEHFSFRDDLGGGKLKKRIRNMLGWIPVKASLVRLDVLH
jgi:hypothetical protein